MALTDRELQVLNHIAKGLRNKEIGAALNIAEDTVKIHIKNIFGKLNVIDRTAAVARPVDRKSLCDAPIPQSLPDRARD